MKRKGTSFTWCMSRLPSGEMCHKWLFTSQEIKHPPRPTCLKCQVREKRERKGGMKKVSEMSREELTRNGYIMNLKGKEYSTVNYRVLVFREEHPSWSIRKEILERTPKSVLVRCWIENEEGRILSEDFAEEFTGGRIPALEKACTAAMGRALAAMGYSPLNFASYEEMQGKNETTHAHPTQRSTGTNRTPKIIKPQKTHEELSYDTSWINELMPWSLETDQEVKKFTWEELEHVDTIKCKNGSFISVYAWLLESSKSLDPIDKETSDKCQIMAGIIKGERDKEVAQSIFFKGEGEVKTDQYSEESIGA